MARQDVEVPPYSQMDVQSVDIFNQFKTPNETADGVDDNVCITDVEFIMSGLCTSRTLVCGRYAKIPIRMMNVSREPLHVDQSDDLEAFKEVTLQETVENTDTPAAEGRFQEKLIRDVDASVPDSDKKELRNKINEYGDIFLAVNTILVSPE